MRQENIDRKQKHILWQYAFPFGLMLGAACMMCALMFGYAYQSKLRERMDYYLLLLESAMTTVENSLDVADNLAVFLNKEQELYQYMCASRQNDIEKKLAVNRTEANLQADDSLIAQYMVYSYKQESFLLGSNLYVYPELTYEYALKYGDLSYDEWLEYVFPRIAKTRMLPSSKALLQSVSHIPKDYILYVRPYVNMDNGKLLGHTAFYLDTGKIEALFRLSEQEGMLVQILYDGETVLYASEASMRSLAADAGNVAESGFFKSEIDGREYHIACTQSNAHKISFYAAVGKRTLAAECLTAIAGTMIYALGLLALVFIVAAFTVMHSRQSLRNISQWVPDSGRLSVFEGIERAMNGLHDDNHAMRQELNRQNTQLREALWKTAVYGGIQRVAEFERAAAQCGLCLEGRIRNVAGLYLTVRPLKSALNQNVVAEMLQSAELGLIPLFWEDERRLAVLCSEGEIGEEAAKRVQKLFLQIAQQCEAEVRGFVGSLCADISTVYVSYDQARHMMTSGAHDDEGVLVTYRVDDIERYDYSIYDEDRINAAIAHAAQDTALRILKQLYEINFEKRKLSRTTRKLLYYRILSTLSMTEYAQPLEEILYLADENMDPGVFFEACKIQVVKMCEVVRQKAEHQRQSSSEIRRFIDENYTDCNMSLTMVAQRFDRTEVYLSGRLKTILGESFSSYLEKKRIGRAQELFAEGQRSVSVVAEMVGYSSSSVFGRAYKRVTGITPKEYLNSI